MTEPSTLPLARLMGMAFRQLIDDLHAALRDQGWDDVRQSYGLVLLAIRDEETTTTELASLLGVSKQAVSKLLGAMEGSGYVERRAVERDGRVKSVRLGARGHDLLGAVDGIYAEIEAEWADALGQVALDQTRARIERVIRERNGGSLPPLRPT